MAPKPAQTLHVTRLHGQGWVMAGGVYHRNKLPSLLSLVKSIHRQHLRALGKQGDSLYLKPLLFPAK